MKNLIILNSIYGRTDQLVAFPETLRTREAIAALNELILEAQRETRSTFPPGKTVGDFEEALFACLAQKMTDKGFSIIETERLQRTKKWNEIRPTE